MGDYFINGVNNIDVNVCWLADGDAVIVIVFTSSPDLLYGVLDPRIRYA